MNDRHAEFSSAEPDGYREAATLVVGKLAALIPLKDTIAATKNGQTFVDYFASAISAYDKQRALIETLVKALEPFAGQAETFDGIGGKAPIPDHYMPSIVDHTIGDLRRARAAISAAPVSRGPDFVSRDVHEAMLDSQYRAGAAAGWNAAHLPEDEANTKFAALIKVQAGDLAALAAAKE